MSQVFSISDHCSMEVELVKQVLDTVFLSQSKSDSLNRVLSAHLQCTVDVRLQWR